VLRSGMMNTIREAIQHSPTQRLVGTEGRPAIEVSPGGLWTLRGTVAQREIPSERIGSREAYDAAG
jgi:hypothetical protein